MAVEVKHQTQASDPQTPPLDHTDWNAAHVVNLTGPALLGRVADTQGAAAEIALAHSLTLDSTGLRLIGDAESPGAGKYYGTDGNGARGWQTFAHTHHIDTDTTGSLPPARLAQANAATNQVLTWNGTQWAPATPAGSGQSAIQFQDEGNDLGTAGTVTAVNFVGAGVTASRSGNVVTVNVAGGGGGGGLVFEPGDIYWSYYSIDRLPRTQASGTGASAGALSAFTNIPFSGGVLCQTGTTATGMAFVGPVANNDTQSSVFYPRAGYKLFCETLFWIVGPIFDSTDDYRVVLAYGDGNNSLSVSARGAQIFVNAATTTWTLRTQNAASQSTTASTGVSAAIETVYRVRMEIDDNGSVVRGIVNGAEATITTNFDGSTRYRFNMGIVKQEGTNNRALIIGYFWIGYRPL